MCFYFASHNTCPRCLITFNARLNRVPCWNGHTVPRWLSPHTHGLRCRSGVRQRAPAEVYTHRRCPDCEAKMALEDALRGAMMRDM